MLTSVKVARGLLSGLVFLIGAWLVWPRPGASAATTSQVQFAVIGDYGVAARSTPEATAEARVAALVDGWEPDFIVTTGDNNYPDGEASTMQQNVGAFYGTYVESGRFFPSLGNHDYNTDNAQPYLDYFELPGNERYYDFTQGPVHFFVLDADPIMRGVEVTTTQASWLQAGLAASSAPWKLVVMHQEPYGSGQGHGSHPILQWPFSAWGADAVLAGHSHNYERLQVDELPYFVNGAGGAALYGFDTPPETGSLVRYSAKHGAMLVEASQTHILYRFFAFDGTLVDSYQVGDPLTNTPTASPTRRPDLTDWVWLPALFAQ